MILFNFAVLLLLVSAGLVSWRYFEGGKWEMFVIFVMVALCFAAVWFMGV